MSQNFLSAFKYGRPLSSLSNPHRIPEQHCPSKRKSSKVDEKGLHRALDAEQDRDVLVVEQAHDLNAQRAFLL